MTNLTDRMARIAWITHRDRQLAQLGMKPSEYAADIPIPDWAYTLADAVIRELDTALTAFGSWLSEEITGQPLSRIDVDSCVAEWKWLNDESRWIKGEPND